MKHYMLFCYETRYPFGGWHNFKGSYDTLEQAQEAAGGKNAHIVDRASGLVVWRRDATLLNEVAA